MLLTHAPSGDATASTQVDNTLLDAKRVSSLLPTTDEVNQRLGWTDDVNFSAPDFSSIENMNPAGLIEASGGPLALGVECADAITKYGVIAGAPVGALDMTANMWAEREVTVRTIWLARYPSTEAATAQISGLPAVIEACPTFNLTPGRRAVAVIPSSLDGAVAYRASDSYTWVVASFGNLVAQVKIGTSDEELKSGEALIRLQLDKLELIARGEYK